MLHGLGSTDTYLRGRLLRGAFNIVLTNDPNDDDGNRAADDGVVISGRQAAELRTLVAACSADPTTVTANETRVLAKLGLNTLHTVDDVAPRDFVRVRNALLTKRAVLAQRTAFVAKQGVAA